MIERFDVEDTMKVVSDRYVEEHDKVVNAIHEKIRRAAEESKK